jgi:ribosomal protein L11 methyltransferase
MTINPGQVGGEDHRQTEWNELWLAASTTISDDVAASLMYADAWGVETLAPHANPHFLPRLEDEPARVLPETQLAESWEWLIITFPPEVSEDDARGLAESVASEFGTSPDVWFLDRFEHRKDTDWLHRWKRYFKPIQLSSKTWICPSWESLEVDDAAVVIKVDPGLSFGTGQHPTTKLCLKALETYLRGWDPTKSLDVGCGSGILSIALALWGRRNIVGLDIDPASPEAFETNAKLNQIGDAAQFDARDLSEVEGESELVVANIIAPILESLAAELVKHTARGGHLLLSGILDEQLDPLIEHFQSEFKAQGRHPSEPTITADEDTPWRALWWRLA